MIDMKNYEDICKSNITWLNDNGLSIDNVHYRLEMDTKELQEGKSTNNIFLLGKSKKMVDRVINFARDLKSGKILEIGILQGGSVALYDQIFNPNKIVAIEYMSTPVESLEKYIKLNNRLNAIKPYYGVNQSDAVALKTMLDHEFPESDLDIVFDDGAHLYDETKAAFNSIFPYMKHGGLYCIEDWGWAHWSGDYWQNGGNEFLADKTPMSNLIVELLVMSASRPDLIESIEITGDINASMAVIKRGNGYLSGLNFNIDDYCLSRGQTFIPCKIIEDYNKKIHGIVEDHDKKIHGVEALLEDSIEIIKNMQESFGGMKSEANLIYANQFTPKSIENPHAWIGHIPFMAWLLRSMEPKLFVELGTHSGNSYFAACQTIEESNLETKCFAVDTWEGDPHAGQYSDDIFNKVNLHNQTEYAKFSKLFRMTFDEALSQFQNQSIDLLHIDGLHTYDAVKHDFETWLPKLSDGAVILFHDTQVFERDFGVWKMWEDLKSIYPNNIEFIHSHGLGILQLNTDDENKKLPFLRVSDAEKTKFIDYFGKIASRSVEMAEFKSQQLRVHHLQSLVATYEQNLNAIKNSTSWKISAPLRAVGRFLK